MSKYLLECFSSLGWQWEPWNASLCRAWFAHREIFSKSYQIKLKSDCIYHTPINLEQQKDAVRLLLFQINRCMVNTIWFRFDLIRFWKDISSNVHREIFFQSEFQLVRNQSEEGHYNPNLSWISKIWERFSCARGDIYGGIKTDTGPNLRRQIRGDLLLYWRFQGRFSAVFGHFHSNTQRLIIISAFSGLFSGVFGHFISYLGFFSAEFGCFIIISVFSGAFFCWVWLFLAVFGCGWLFLAILFWNLFVFRFFSAAFGCFWRSYFGTCLYLSFFFCCFWLFFYHFLQIRKDLLLYRPFPGFFFCWVWLFLAFYFGTCSYMGFFLLDLAVSGPFSTEFYCISVYLVVFNCIC